MLDVNVRGAAAIVVLLGGMTGCEGGGRSFDATPALIAAVERTIASDSFHIETTQIVESQGTFHGDGDYIAPDRLSIFISGPGAATTIIIGRDHYVSEPERTDRFSHWRDPCSISIDVFIPALDLVRGATDVSASGETYVFRAEGSLSEAEGEARVENGYLSSLRLRYEIPELGDQVEERWVFSRFGDADVTIEAPSEAQVINELVEDVPSISTYEGSPAPCP
jgi:hypothetical protein